MIDRNFLLFENKICLISIDEYVRVYRVRGEGRGRTRSFEMADLKSIRERGRSRSDEPRKRPLAKVWKEFR